MIPRAATETATARVSGNGDGNGKSYGDNGGDASLNHYKIKCPECSGTLVFEEGCVKCHGCGYAQC